MERLPEFAGQYHEVNKGRFWNYHFTAENFEWPSEKQEPQKYVIDSFSPNLNKTLRVHHLRGLALAKSLDKILSQNSHSVFHVSLLGASQGVLSEAISKLKKWFDFLDFYPNLNYDVLQPWDYVDCRLVEDSENPMNGCKVWDGPKGPVIVVRSDGRPTYTFYEIAFAKNINPTHYLTGVEQKEHFEALGLGDKHLPMGLVLGKDGKKMKSRSGDSPSADEIIENIKERLEETPEPEKLAWNVLAWNFLHVSRAQNVKYDPDLWTDPDAPGLYITYTYARMMSALRKSNYHARKMSMRTPSKCDFEEDDSPCPINLTESDVELLGCAAYLKHYTKRAIASLDPTQLANYAHTLARRLGTAYHQEKIDGGRYAFQFAVAESLRALKQTMSQIAMFPLEKV